MRILMINSVCGIRSTGRICIDLAKKYIADGHEVRIAYGREVVPLEYQPISVPICDNKDVCFNALKARLFDNEGFNCKKTTQKFLKWAEEYDPDLVWLHNLHGYYINVELLFAWIKSRPNMQVKWTLHDCWAFTGHCAYFTMVECDKWKSYCIACTQKRSYPTSCFVDNCNNNFYRKKVAFTDVKNMSLVTPSKWLADLVKQSFLKDYPVEVVYNTIDREVFRPTESDFRDKFSLQDKIIVLGVAAVWDERKGLADFVELSRRLGDSFAVVLVGLTQKQIRKMPKNILCIPRTNSTTELAKIYTAADVFINPSKEETFGLTTIEALFCDTPAIVYKHTACEEVINIYGNGVAVDDSVDALLDAIKEYIEKHNLHRCE